MYHILDQLLIICHGGMAASGYHVNPNNSTLDSGQRFVYCCQLVVICVQKYKPTIKGKKPSSDITRNVPRPRAPLHFISKRRETETAGLDG